MHLEGGEFKMRIIKYTMIIFLALIFIFGMDVLANNEENEDTKKDEEQEKKEEYYKIRRHLMVKKQIDYRTVRDSRKGVEDKRVLEAMRTVPRHKFVPEHLREFAYADRPLAIGYDQTISQPYIVAFMTELLEPQKDDIALEVGTGSGYQAAVLSELVKEVYTIEIIPELGEQAKKRLKRLEYKNVEVKIADGYYGWEEHAPYDIIIVTAAANHIPPPLIKQLKPGGKMCIPVGGRFSIQNLILVEKKKDGNITTKNTMAVRFVPLTGKH